MTAALAPRPPLPMPDEASAPFWAAAREGRLDIQRCAACHRWNHAPTMACPACGSMKMGYETVSGRASLFSWTVLHHAPAPGFREMMPLIVGIVELVEHPHLLMTANLPGLSEAELKLGLPLQVTFERISDDCTLPQFARAKA